MNSRATWRGWVLILCTAACGDENVSPIPALSDFTFENPAVSTGGVVQVQGSIDYVDGDGDIESLFIKVTIPNGQSQTVGPSPAEGVQGRRTGTFGFGFSLNAAASGVYVLEVWVVDQQGSPSNHVTASVTAS